MAPSLGIPQAAWASAAVVLSLIVSIVNMSRISQAATLRPAGGLFSTSLQGSAPWQKSALRRNSDMGQRSSPLLHAATGGLAKAVSLVTGLFSLATRITAGLKSLYIQAARSHSTPTLMIHSPTPPSRPRLW